MTRGRKKIPTKLKELRGTTRKDRLVENEMVATQVLEIPEPPNWLSEIGKIEFTKVCNELFGKNMLHVIDLRLIEAYANEISLYIETEQLLREKGRIQVYKNKDGSIKHAQVVPYVKVARDALNSAMKIATQFGLTPSARSSISVPQINIQHNEHNYFD
tara:strand:- start:834 stop:1310 length:477 start_codon:yes stop_codon:yes gene_type:complete